MNVNVDRVKAAQLGLTQRDVTSSMLISLSGNNQVAPNFWMNPANGVSYNVGVQTSQYRIDSMDELLRTPITAATSAVNTTTAGSLAGVAATGNASVSSSPSGASQAYGNPGAMPNGTQLLSNLVDVERSYGPVIINHYNVAPVFDVYANVDRRDLGSVGGEVEKIMKEEADALAARNHVQLAGRVRDHADLLRPARTGDGVRRGAGVSPDGRELPVLARPVHHSDGAAGSDRGNPVDAVRHRHHAERSVADGFHHVRRRGHGQQHPDGHVRE